MVTLLDLLRQHGRFPRTAKEAFERLGPSEQQIVRKRFGCSCTTTDLIDGPHHAADCERWSEGR